MDSIKTFYEYLHRFIPLSEEEYENFILPFLNVRRFEKKELLTKAGEVEEYFNFITKGLIRKYYKREGEEINLQISTEGHIIHADESFHSRTPSEYYVEAIEPSIVVSITFEDLERIYAQHAKMERLGRLMITSNTIERNDWQVQMMKFMPRERFVRFMECHPDLLQRVPQKYLASYLNIQPETFSRFKHLLRPGKATPIPALHQGSSSQGIPQ
jgi:CRP-like cAMP-binding protein